jgi:glycine cleavage system H protein
MSNYPTDRRYDSDGAWVKVEGKIATIGLTQDALAKIGELIHVDFVVSTGKVVHQGDYIASVESVKAVTVFPAPVSGKIIAINPTLEQDPELVNEDPYGTGWLCKIELSNPAEYQALMAQPN